MAGLDAQLSTFTQLGLVGQLRWQLFRNSLKTLRGRLELVSKIIATVMLSGMVVAIAIGSAVGAYFAVHDGKYWLIRVVLWVIALIWQAYPILVAASTVQFDSRNMLRFPLRFSSFAVLSLAYGLFDPAAIAGLIWLGTFSLGILLARPALLAGAIPILILFAVMNLVLGRMVFAWIERWLARRRTREIIGVIFFVLILSMQFIGPAIQHWGGHGRAPNFSKIAQIQRALPPGAAAEAIIGAARNDWTQAGLRILLLLAYCAIFGGLLTIRLRAQYRGEDLGESQAPVALSAASSSARAVAPGWQLPGSSPAVSAMFEKEIHYLFRSGPALFNLATPLVLLAFFGISSNRPGRHFGALGHAADFMFPIAVGYAFLVQANTVYNCFAFDGNGIDFLFVAPVRFREVFAAKNLFMVFLTLLETSLVWLVVTILAGAPSAMVVLAMLAALVYASLVNFSVGNYASVRFPKRLEFAMFRQQRVSGITLLISLIAQACILGSCAAVFLLGRWKGMMWLSALIYLVLAAAAWPVYQWALGRSGEIALDQREVLSSALSRRE
jgi:ABC-2 type transport system permease protein